MGRRKSVLLALLLVGTALPWLPAQVADSSLNSVVVLRNGRVLLGRVCRMGDSYVVSLGADGEARLAAGDVEMVCGSLDEAYFYKRDRLRGDDLQGRLELAEWCLRNGCSWRAADQLLAVFNVAPAHPRLAVLERRLFSTDAEHSAAANASATSSNSVGDEDLVATPALLPDGATVHFTQKVQPVLLNRCASNACHGGRSAQKFKLERSLRGQPLSNRLTQRNLQAALSFVNVQQPDESPLLAAPRQPHGGLSGPVFGVRESAQYDQLLAWVRLAATRRADSESAIAKGAVPEFPPIVPGMVTESSSVQQAGFSFPAAAESVTEQPALGTDVLQRLPAASPVANDPFDPEAFNREFATPPTEPTADQAANAP